jgi:hypothetical protein
MPLHKFKLISATTGYKLVTREVGFDSWKHQLILLVRSRTKATEFFFFSPNVQTSSEIYPPSNPMGTGEPPLRGKAAEV